MVSRPLAIKLADQDAERVRVSHERALTELQAKPAATEVVLRGVVLEAGKATYVPHGLGRAPTCVLPSIPRGAAAAGWIDDIRTGVDLTKFLLLQANGYGATITVDLRVA